MKIAKLSNVEIVQRDYGIMKILAGRRTKIMQSKLLDLKILEIEPHTQTSKHFHKLSESVFYFVHGEAILEIQGTFHKMQMGDIALIDPLEIHQVSNNSDVKCVVIESMSPAYSKDDIFFVE